MMVGRLLFRAQAPGARSACTRRSARGTAGTGRRLGLICLSHGARLIGRNIYTVKILLDRGRLSHYPYLYDVKIWIKEARHAAGSDRPARADQPRADPVRM